MLQGHSLATQFGHSIVDPVPSLFTFKINDPLLAELAGVIFLCFYTFKMYHELLYLTLFLSLAQISFSKVQAKLKLEHPRSDMSKLVQVCISLPHLFNILYHEDRFFKFTCFVSRLVQCL